MNVVTRLQPQREAEREAERERKRKRKRRQRGGGGVAPCATASKRARHTTILVLARAPVRRSTGTCSGESVARHILFVRLKTVVLWLKTAVKLNVRAEGQRQRR